MKHMSPLLPLFVAIVGTAIALMNIAGVIVMLSKNLKMKGIENLMVMFILIVTAFAWCLFYYTTH